MTLLQIKSILGALFFLMALTSFLSMMALMGRPDKASTSSRLRVWHRASGRIAFLLLLGLLVLGFRFWVALGDPAPPRIVLHAFLALGLAALFVIKLAVVKIYKQFLKMAPVMGILLFGLTFVVYAVSGGFELLSPPSHSRAAVSEFPSAGVVPAGNPDAGRILFDAKCLGCHDPSGKDFRSGPGLQGLLKAENLPSGRPGGRPAVLDQLRRPLASMPAFPDLSDEDAADLLAYLETL